MLLSSIFTALVAASVAHAHATFQELWVNGGTTVPSVPLDDDADDFISLLSGQSRFLCPVTRQQQPSDRDIACNVGGTTAAPSTCSVAAGTTVTIEMHQQPGDRSCSNEAIGGNHDGPVIVYMAKVDDAATAVGAQANWFKIAQTGLVSTDYWGTDVLNANCGKMDVKIPSDIAPGSWSLKQFSLALHVASSVGGAQFYMSCYQLNVSGSGNASPATVKLPGAYSATDPGILFNLYAQYSSYTIPGPAVYEGGAGPAPSTSKPVTSAPATSAGSSTSAPPVSTAPAGTIPKWGQCGGIGWTGATGCVSGSTCTKLNDYYFQCI
ncbi:hypothetical protein NLI96_g7345 [Meripilus lineatus]|uniref:AA9 family lytic polysaccharide monooxygenase n=1 Tax=Meripilus lineatus TaxID=2056292 RepID=A0AAD5YD21_9APHY|nr:hypothetical protein NLI96_g7345 [Physisporinus lineatus]